ncbi:putative protein S-acyltransferase [Helianthus annuus]|nr:putative protein S-acyltransferase [Helianthus annuus]
MATCANCAIEIARISLLFKGNARKLFEKRYEGAFGRLSKLGLAPALICVIFALLLTYINSVIMASNLPKLTAGSAFFAWMGVLFASSGLILFSRCSRYVLVVRGIMGQNG